MKAIFGLGLACLLISCLAAPLVVASDVEETSTDEGGTGDSVTEHHNTNGTEHEEGGEHEEEHVSVHVVSWNYERVATPLMLCLVILCAGILKLIFHYADCLSSIVPESCLLIIFGVIVGAIIDIDAHPEVTQLDPDVFMLYLLPPIVLDSAYSLNDRVVFNNIGTILLFAGVGTIVNFLVIGPSLYALAWSGAMGTININIIQCLLFSSFIVAVDPVAVLAIFSEIGVNTKLYFLVFGESLLNDAVTIVLYNMMVAFNQLPEITYDQILIGVASFFTISLGALSIGIGHGVICSVLTRFTGHVRVTEPLVIIITAYLSYLVAELFHWSGIISMIACGIMQAQYALHNISRKSYITVKYFVKMVSSSADCIVFIYLGLELVRTSHVWHAGFIVWSLSLCLIVRLLCVFTLTAIVNAKQHVSPIGIREQFIMWYGGLRGAVCFALAATLSSDFPLRQVFLTTTLVVIIFTVFVQGLTIKPLVSLCKIEREAEKHRSIALEFNLHVTDHMMAGVEVILGQLGDNYIRSLLQRINDKYLRQALMVNPMTQDERILAKYQKIAVRDHVKHIYEATSKEVDVGDVDKSEDILGDDTETQPKEEIRPKRHSRFHANRGEGEDGEDREKLAQLRWAMAKSVVTMFHQKYDKNLTRDDENDLVGHLREKHHRIAENHRMRSPPTSPRGTAPSSPSTRRRSFKNRTTSLTYDNEEDKKVAVPTRAASETVDPSKHALLAQRLRNLKNAAAQNKIEENSNREPRLRVEQVENNIADRPNIDPVLDYYKQHSTAAAPPGAPNGRNSRSIPSPLTYQQNIFDENHEDVAVSPKDDAYKEKNINTSFEYPPSSSDNNGFPRSSGGSTDYTPPGTQYGVAHAFTNPAYEGSLDSQDNAPLRQRRAGVSSTPRSELQPPRADPVERSESAARRFTTLIRVGSRDASIEQETETDQESMATKL